jgi:hypothetical protein
MAEASTGRRETSSGTWRRGRWRGLGGERQLFDEFVECAAPEGLVVSTGEAFVEMAQDGIDGVETLAGGAAPRWRIVSVLAQRDAGEGRAGW